MRIALIHDVQIPVTHYGGTERALWWLAKGLHETGHSVILLSRPGSHCPYAEVRPFDPTRTAVDQAKDADVLHYFNSPPVEPSRPHVITIQGNGKPGERFFQNTNFVSGDHARRHGAECFVYNGVDPDEYLFSDRKEPYLAFLAKASWRVKNVKGAIRIARKSGRPLHIMGGDHWLSPLWKFRRIYWEGTLGTEAKSKILARASGLLFPVLWDEPFGIAVVESMICGTPVMGTRRGSLPELISRESGFLCDSEGEFAEKVGDLASFSPKKCREYAIEKFHYRNMVEGYRRIYERVLRGEKLNTREPIGA